MLRTKSGNKYKGLPAKIFVNAISNKTLFSVEGNQVSLKQAAADQEEALFTPHIVKKEPKAGSDPNNPVKMLKRFRKSFLDNPSTVGYINKPLPGITGNEDLVTVANKLGHDRFLGMIQGFHMSKLMFINKINNKEDEFTNSYMEKRLEYLQNKLRKIDDSIN